MDNQETKNESPKTSRTLQGVVVSVAMDKTAVVEVETHKSHPKYHKVYKSNKRYKAHDPENSLKEGDLVVIKETRPISKDKRWIFESKIENNR